MSECSECGNLVLARCYQDDRCREGNPMRRHPYRLHVSLFKDCLGFKSKTEQL